MNSFLKALCRPPVLVTAVIIAIAAHSCNKFPEPVSKGSISWRFQDGRPTRSMAEIPDTDAFILSVKNSSGTVLYEGPYGGSPESMLLDPGTYSVKVVSMAVDLPAFSSPVFGDEQVAVVSPGTGTNVSLNCSQINSGVRLRVSPDFVKSYPEGTLCVRSSSGQLEYLPSESRTGYFNPGVVDIFLNNGGASEKLASRCLEPCEMLTLGISCPSPDPSCAPEMTITVDTSRVWMEDSCCIGSGGGDTVGGSKETAFGVSAAMEHIGETGVWVCGYVVGGDLSSSKNGISFAPPFESQTNLAIAARSSASDKSSCMSVQLASGTLRKALNLVDNPSLLGTKIFLKGDIVASYYGIPGLQNITDCSTTN